MTYLQLEAISGNTQAQRDASVALMVATGYSPVATSTIRFDEQEHDPNGLGWQAQQVGGLGLTAVDLTTTASQVGSTVRFVRPLGRDVDIVLRLHASNLADREARFAKLETILSGECLLRMSEWIGTTIALPTTYKYLRVYFAGGGDFSIGGKGGATDTELETVITLRAHKPNWLTGIGG